MIDDNIFNQWNEVKKVLNKKERNHFFKEGQIWWCSIGQNIGSESYGKGEKFARPILIIKRLSAELFIGIPLTSKIKTGSWFVSFKHRDKDVTCMLHQIRMFDVKRFSNHIGQIDNEDFENVLESLGQLLGLKNIHPSLRRESVGKSQK